MHRQRGLTVLLVTKIPKSAVDGCTWDKLVWRTCQGRKLPNGAALALQSAAATARTVGIGVFDRSTAAASDGATTCMQISGRLYMVPHRLQAARHLSPLAG